MKELSKVLSVIENIKSMSKDVNDKKDLRKLQLKINQLDMVRRYLEYNPREQFILDTKMELEEGIKKLEYGYKEWLNSTPKAKELKNPESKFRSEVGITAMKRKLKMINYVLSDDYSIPVKLDK